MIALLKLIRAGNLLIMLLTQVLVYFCLSDTPLTSFFLPASLVLVMLSTSMAAAGGYVINDYHDIKMDQINKPHRVIIGHQISRRQGMALHLSFTACALLLASGVNLNVFLAVLLCCLILWIYAFHLKKQFLSGNLIVAALSAFTLLILLLTGIPINRVLLLVYAGFAFLISLIREIIKDLEDAEGDRLDHCQTLPIVWGVKRTKQFLYLLNFLLLILITGFLYALLHSVPGVADYYLLYSLVLILFPVGIGIYRLWKADSKSDYSRLSNGYKIIMLTGVLSMALFRI